MLNCVTSCLYQLARQVAVINKIHSENVVNGAYDNKNIYQRMQDGIHGVIPFYPHNPPIWYNRLRKGDLPKIRAPSKLDDWEGIWSLGPSLTRHWLSFPQPIPWKNTAQKCHLHKPLSVCVKMHTNNQSNQGPWWNIDYDRLSHFMLL